MATSLLFIVRDASAASHSYRNTATNGVALSTEFLVDALSSLNITTTSRAVSSAEDIAWLVVEKKPTHVIIETLWLTSTEMQTLVTEFPSVTWIVRDHSESCFRTLETDATQRIYDYLKLGVEVMSNSVRSMTDIMTIATNIGVSEDLASYGPNVYPIPERDTMVPRTRTDGVVNIGCFGAVRPMKNHITQAIAAIQFAQNNSLALKFHINSYNIAGYIDPVLNNLRALFSNAPSQFELVEHEWMDRSTFLSLLETMDICSQTSFTETFNIVTADAMARAVPIVASDCIAWLGETAKHNPVSSVDIACAFEKIWNAEVEEQKLRLLRQRSDMLIYVRSALKVWNDRFGS